MKKELFAYYLTQVNKVASQIMWFIIIPLLIFLYIQQSQTIDLIKQISQDNTAKLDEALPNTFPLKFDSPQDVLREPPVFHLDEPVNVEARFLNETDHVLTLSADVHWQLVTHDEDVGMIEPIQVGLFITLEPGCTKIPFANTPPLAVVTITKQLFDKGHSKVTWRLAGTNQIIGPTAGGNKKFEVDEFNYVPDNVPIPENQTRHIEDTCELL